MKFTEGQSYWRREMQIKANGLATANVPLRQYEIARLTGEYLAWKINQLPTEEREQAIADLFFVAVTHGEVLE